MSKNTESNQTPRSSSPKPPRSRALDFQLHDFRHKKAALVSAAFLQEVVLTD